VFISSYKSSGFTASINWYRNLDRNWHILADVNPIIKHPTLMIYGDKDQIPKLEGLSSFVPNVEEKSIDCGHWIQQERPNETNTIILEWLDKQN
jgi:pimeloyl-ACP methyl ester carboxylesterase